MTGPDSKALKQFTDDQLRRELGVREGDVYMDFCDILGGNWHIGWHDENKMLCGRVFDDISIWGYREINTKTGEFPDTEEKTLCKACERAFRKMREGAAV